MLEADQKSLYDKIERTLSNSEGTYSGRFSKEDLILRALVSRDSNSPEMVTKIDAALERDLPKIEQDLKKEGLDPALNSAPFLDLISRLYLEALNKEAVRDFIRKFPALLEKHSQRIQQLRLEVQKIIQDSKISDKVSIYALDIEQEMILPKKIKYFQSQKRKDQNYHGVVEAYLMGQEQIFLSKPISSALRS